MENKKDIGKVFKDKLEQLDKTPSNRLWADIEKDLDAKKKRRPIFWLFPILFALGLGLGAYYYFTDYSKNSITKKEKKDDSNQINTEATTQLNDSEVFENQTDENTNRIVSKNSNGDEIENENITNDGNTNNRLNSNVIQTKNAKNSPLENTKAMTSNQSFANRNQNQENPQDKQDNPGGNKAKSNTKMKSDAAKNLVKSNNKNTPTSKIHYIKEPIKIITNSKRLVKSTPEFDEYEVVKKYTYVITKKRIVIKPKRKPSKSSLAYKNPKTKSEVKKSSKKNVSTLNKNKKQHPVQKTTKNNHNDTKTNNAVEEITETNQNISNNKLANQNTIPEIKKDTIVADSLQKKVALKDTKKKKKQDPVEVVKKKSKPTYLVSGFYGPTVYGLFSKNSSPNKNFKGLKKGHPITSYYGFSFKTLYGKVGFKAGVSKINLSLSNTLNQDQLIPSYSNITLNGNTSAASITQTYQSDSNIKLTHELSYYEFPIEFYYSIMEDKHKMSVGIFTGLSFMIRDKNVLYMSSDQKNKSEIGYINNATNSNLSVNLGVGLSYNIYKKIYFDCNPVVKFYSKTFKEENPAKFYSFSLQTGVSYKF